MKPGNYLILGTALSLLFAAPAVSRAQSAPTGQILDPAAVAWPRTFTADGYDMAIFQPQISTWKGNQLGIIMIGTGLVALALATMQHRGALRVMHERCPELPPSLAGVMAAFFALLGILALFSVILRMR